MMVGELQALERFIVENDDLLELEQHIGRFNIFDALRIVEREVKHSDFLAWLIDSNESHGQGGLFLRAVLMDLFKAARETGFACPVSPIELDGEELRGVEIRREWRNIDLLIRCDQPRFVVAIENKIRSGEHSNQLARYREIVETEFGDVPSMYVFLTVEGDEPSEEDWVPYGYRKLHGVLERVRGANETSIGEDVRAFLDHYLKLIRGRLMIDPEIVRLCQRIYKNHRQALQLIYEHAGSPAAGLLGRIETAIAEHNGEWHIVSKTSNRVFFIHNRWLDLFPPIGKRPNFDARCWIVLRFQLLKKRAIYSASAWPTTHPALREKVIGRLTADPKEFGFQLRSKSTSEMFTQFGTQPIGRWSEEKGPEEDEVLAAVKKKLDDLKLRLSSLPAAIEPLIEQWKHSK